jgi:hypothetical protein
VSPDSTPADSLFAAPLQQVTAEVESLTQMVMASPMTSINARMLPIDLSNGNSYCTGLIYSVNNGQAPSGSLVSINNAQVYAEMRGGHKFEHAVKCELTYDRVRFVFLSSYDKKGTPIPPDKNAGDDGLGDLTWLRQTSATPSIHLSCALTTLRRWKPIRA